MGPGFVAACALGVPCLVAGQGVLAADLAGASVLTFSKTTGYRHASIPAGLAMLRELAKEHGFDLVATEESAVFTDDRLREFDAVVFLNTTGNVLDLAEQGAMERYIGAGGGFVGIHSAADTEHDGDWNWYGKLVGGTFLSHPNEPSNVQRARIEVVSAAHPATAALPSEFWHEDEWYDFRDLVDDRTDLLAVDESTYSGGRHGDYHPIAWYHEWDGGRAFYTGFGHTAEAYEDQRVRAHILGGLRYALGDDRGEGFDPNGRSSGR